MPQPRAPWGPASGQPLAGVAGLEGPRGWELWLSARGCWCVGQMRPSRLRLPTAGPGVALAGAPVWAAGFCTRMCTRTHTHTHNTRLPQRVPDPQSQLKPPTTLEGESRSLGLAQGTGGQRGGCVPGGPGRGETGTPTAASPTGETPGWRSRSSALWPGPPRPPAPQAGWRVLGSDHICFFLSCGWLKCRAVEGPFKRLLA